MFLSAPDGSYLLLEAPFGALRLLKTPIGSWQLLEAPKVGGKLRFTRIFWYLAELHFKRHIHLNNWLDVNANQNIL